MNLKHRMDHDEELKRHVHTFAILFAFVAFVIGLASGWTFPFGTLICSVVLMLLMNSLTKVMGVTKSWIISAKTQWAWLASAVVGQSGTAYLVSGSWKITLWADFIFLFVSALVWTYERWNWSRA